MNIAEKPIAGIKGRRISTGDGLHLIANHYRRGTRLDTHMHREAQLVYAARGTMQVTTPKGRWLVPPDRAVWVPALSEHAIDVLADIEMRTLYFDLAWLKREERSAEAARRRPGTSRRSGPVCLPRRALVRGENLVCVVGPASPGTSTRRGRANHEQPTLWRMTG